MTPRHPTHSSAATGLGRLCLCMALIATACTSLTPTPSPTPAPTPTPLPDSDADGAPDALDDCPALANPARSDLDGDGVGDACDPDIDGDEWTNVGDACPFNATDECVGAQPVSVNLLNPAVLNDQNSARVGYVGLTYFENPNPGLPGLLNGRVYPAAAGPLFTEANDLTLRLGFELRAASGTWPTAEGAAGLSAGALELVCPAVGVAGMPGICTGHLTLSLLANGAPMTSAAECLPADARCAWSMNAAFGSKTIVNVWGGYDAEANELRFSSGLPTHPGNTFTTTYSVDVELSDGSRAAYSGVWPAASLPYAIADGENDCQDSANQPIACQAFGDLRTVSIEPTLENGSPFLTVSIETGEPLPLDRRSPYALFSVFLLVLEGEELIVQVLDFFPEDGNWRMRGFESRGGSAELTPLPELPAGLSFTAEGSRALLRLPIASGQQRTVSLYTIRTRVFSGVESLFSDTIRDEGFNATPLVFLQQPSESSPEALPLVVFHQYASPEAEYHAFLLVPYPGSPLAELLSAPPGE